jgi:hypothetical protein
MHCLNPFYLSERRLDRCFRRYVRWGGTALALLLFQFAWTGAEDLAEPADEDAEEADDGFLDTVYDEAAAEWWNADWKLRRRLFFDDPRLLSLKDGVISLQEPDPLLLYNTGRCQKGLRDLRVLTRMGKILPSGVVNFGHDDGTSFLWVKPGGEAQGTKLVLYLYYSNPKAEPLAYDVPRALNSQERPFKPVLGLEEAAKGAELPSPASPADFFADVVVVEGEDFRTADDKDPQGLRKLQSSEQASLGAFLAADGDSEKGDPGPWLAEAELPAGGPWFLHVRHPLALSGRPCKPFELQVAGQALTCGQQADEPGAFRWQSFPVDMPKTKVELKWRPTGPSGLDCILFARDRNYLPDYRDVTGPVWMRFKMLEPADTAWHASMYCVHTPYSAQGMLGRTVCWLFRDRAEVTEYEAQKRAKEAACWVPPGAWSAWGRAIHSGAYTWFSRISFTTGTGNARNSRVLCQFASRPDEFRVFNQATESTGSSDSVQVLMPTSLRLKGWDGLRRTQTFGQWAQARFRMAQNLGFKAGEGPKRIVVGPMADECVTEEELDYLLKTCSWLGCNTLETYCHDGRKYAEFAGKHGITGYFSHPWAYGLGHGQVSKPDDGLTWTETAEKRLYAAALPMFHAKADEARRISPWHYEHYRFGILGDEIQEATSGAAVNADPLLKGMFIEFLERKGLTPEFFGVRSWQELVAMGPTGVPEQKLSEKEEKEKTAKEAQEKADKALKKAAKEAPDDGQDAEEAALVAALAEKDKAKSEGGTAAGMDNRFIKRAYYWTQKFLSFYYCLFYRQWSRAMREAFPEGARGSVNLQASLTMSARMWDGQCNVWDIGRLGAFNDSILTEDWFSGPIGVAFGYEMIRAAARKNGQTPGSLVVGHTPGARIFCHLAQGSRYLLLYLYGPVHRIGPVWGEHEPTLRDIGETLRIVARCEEDILASKNRPCEAAILVANSSEINIPYRYFPSTYTRMTVYRVLLDSQVPVEVVGEEEVMEDDALKWYKALYVPDPHVAAAAQERIKAWVKEGGVLWGAYAAAAYSEYDERSEVLSEVFGIRERGDSQALAGGWDEIRGKEPKVLLQAKDGGKLPFHSRWHKANWELTTGTALATYEAGGPAFVYNRFGKGQAFLLASVLVQDFASATEEEQRKDPALSVQSIQSRMVRLAAEAAQVQPFVRAGNRLGLYSWVHDGPEQTVLYLLNQGPPIENLDVEVVLPRPPKGVSSGMHGTLESSLVKDGAKIRVNLLPNEGDIVVLK